MTTSSRRIATTTGFSQRLPETDGAKVLPTSDQVGLYLATTHQMAPPEYKAHILLNGPATHSAKDYSNAPIKYK